MVTPESNTPPSTDQPGSVVPSGDHAATPATGAEADQFPSQLSSLIERTVAATRLRHHEREDVRDELRSHFQEGLARGRSADQLVHDFGDEKAIAKLIRRSKIRQRSAAWHFLHRSRQVALVLVVLVVTVYLISAVRFFTGEPKVTMDYLAMLADPIRAIPEDQRAWPIYRDVLLTLNQVDKSEDAGLITAPMEAETPEDESMWADTVAWVEAGESVIPKLWAASAKAGMGLVPQSIPAEEDWAIYPDSDFETMKSDTEDGEPLLEGNLIGVLLPQLSQIREVARFMRAHVWVTVDRAMAAAASEQGSAADVAEGASTDSLSEVILPAPDGTDTTMRAGEIITNDLIAMVRLGEHQNEMPILINQLVGIACYQLALNTTLEVLSEHPDVLSRADLTRIAHAFAGYQRGSLAFDLTGERFMLPDMVQRLYTDDGAGGGHLSARGLAALSHDDMGGLLGVPVLGGGGPVTAVAGPGARLVMLLLLEGGGPVTAVAGPVVLLTAYDRETLLDMHHRRFDRFDALMNTPLWLRTSADTSAGDPVFSDEPPTRLETAIRFDLSALLTPSLERSTVVPWRVMQWRDAALTAIALELARRDTGTWPESLEALVPRYLPRLPIDIYDGAPLRYRVTDADSPVLYALGIDHDDDGGVAVRRSGEYRIDDWRPRDVIDAAKAQDAADPAATRPTAAKIVPDGDWILFDPAGVTDKEEPEAETEHGR